MIACARWARHPLWSRHASRFGPVTGDSTIPRTCHGRPPLAGARLPSSGLTSIAPVRRSMWGALAGTLVAVAIPLWAAPAAQAVFTQCPPVDVDAGCQFLITITNAGPSVAQDTTQAPYESEDDSLIGVQNNSSSAITALPLSAPGTALFGFEADGICDPGGPPLPSGCAPVPGSPA